MQLKEDDIVMCTVISIEGTSVFLEVEGNGKGTMVMSEVAAGRIRNLREYVFPNKKIICKVLKISNGDIQLSLRRVTGKEKQEALDRYKKEKTLASILKTISKEPEKIIEKIRETYSIQDFLEKARENPKLLSEIMSKDEAEKLSKLLSEKKEKEKEAKKIIILKTDSNSGIDDIKEVLSIKDIRINYLGSSQFMLSASAKDFKEANNRINLILKQIQKKAKEKKVFFEIKEK